jgi:hypothetical protein
MLYRKVKKIGMQTYCTRFKKIYFRKLSRVTALEKMELSSVKKTKIRAALENKYMSSDEECQNGFITHQPSWQSEKFKTYKRKLDSKFMDTCSVKSRRLLTKRTIGCDAIKEAPNL